jgi:PPK2 family polyphosphate:nucleotide phosphotransferase
MDIAHLVEQVRVTPGQPARLAKRDPRAKLGLSDEDATKAETAEIAREIDVLQDRLYAEGRRALLVILQGTDTSGKDGTIRAVFNATGPLGVTATPFRRPTEDDLAHDYLRRAHIAAPRRGTIGIFNRSHYEDVLVVKVHNLAPAEEIERRYAQINDFERMLTENGTRVLKFMLHISKERQAERLRDRLEDPTKHWKFDPGDLDDRARWDEFMAAYEAAVTHCSTAYAPWYVVPADRKWVRNAVVARVVLNTLKQMDPQYPAPSWAPGSYTIT